MNETIAKQKVTPKKMNATSARGLNAVKQKIKKLTKDHQTEVDQYRADPMDYLFSDDEDDEPAPKPKKAKAEAKKVALMMASRSMLKSASDVKATEAVSGRPRAKVKTPMVASETAAGTPVERNMRTA